MKIVYIPAKDELFEKCFLPKSCVALLGYGYNAKLNLDNELRGDTNFIRSLCKLSQSQDITFLCPSYLLCGNKTFFGTIVVDNGKLLGISDATHSLCDNVTPSNALRQTIYSLCDVLFTTDSQKIEKSGLSGKQKESRCGACLNFVETRMRLI